MYFQDHYIELIGAASGLLYVLLEINRKKIMWVVGFITSAFYVYIFYDAKFYAGMGLNIYYLLASVYGWIIWTMKSNTSTTVGNETAASREASQIKNLESPLAVKLIIASALLFALLAFILSHYTDSPVPYGDALVSALSFVATWMLAHKIIEQWGLWFFINILSMGLYIWRGLYPTAVLFICYAGASVAGYYKWRKDQMKARELVAK